MRVLYLSYDGALDPLGASQVLPYVEGLAGRGHQFELITFEKQHRFERNDVEALEARLKRVGVGWHPLPYHARPSALATAYDLRQGLQRARSLHAEAPFDLVHVRSYPCATIALSLHRDAGVPYLFDMRGFYPEERVDGGLWRRDGVVFPVAKRLESEFLRSAAGVVTLTEASRPIVAELMQSVGSQAELLVVPTAVDLDRFKPGAPGLPPRIVYLGSVGTWYRVDVMMELARVWLELESDVLVEFLVNAPTPELQGKVAAIGSPRLSWRTLKHDEVPGALAGVLATFAIIDPAPSKVASAPTKIGESLAAGIPVLANRGVGDVADWIEAADVGVAIDEADRVGVRAGAADLLLKARDPAIGQRCRAFAEERLSLGAAVAQYDRAYHALGRGAKA